MKSLNFFNASSKNKMQLYTTMIKNHSGIIIESEYMISLQLPIKHSPCRNLNLFHGWIAVAFNNTTRACKHAQFAGNINIRYSASV